MVRRRHWYERVPLPAAAILSLPSSHIHGCIGLSLHLLTMEVRHGGTGSIVDADVFCRDLQPELERLAKDRLPSTEHTPSRSAHSPRKSLCKWFVLSVSGASFKVLMRSCATHWSIAVAGHSSASSPSIVDRSLSPLQRSGDGQSGIREDVLLLKGSLLNKE